MFLLPTTQSTDKLPEWTHQVSNEVMFVNVGVDADGKLIHSNSAFKHVYCSYFYLKGAKRCKEMAKIFGCFQVQHLTFLRIVANFDFETLHIMIFQQKR